MKKPVVFNINRYFISACVAALIRQGKSVYEIACALKGHEVLVQKFVFTDELREHIARNDRGFINNMLFENPTPIDLYRACATHHVYYNSLKHTFTFSGRFAKTFDGWARKNKLKMPLYNAVLAGCNANRVEHEAGVLPIRTVFAIINLHFNGSGAITIARHFNCKTWQVGQVFKELNIEGEAPEQVMLQRALLLLRGGATRDVVKATFKKLGVEKIKRLEFQNSIIEKIKLLPKVNIMKEPRRRGRLTKTKLKKQQLEQLNQQKCLRYFSLGNEVPQIAKLMLMDQSTVIGLLRKSQAVY